MTVSSFMIVGYLWQILERGAFLALPIREQPQKGPSWIGLIEYWSNIKVFPSDMVFWIIVIRNGKIVLKHGPYCWNFCLRSKLEWLYREYIKIPKNGCFQWIISSWKWLRGCFSHFLLLWIWLCLLLWLAKKTQSTFIVDNIVVPTIWMMAWMKKNVFVLKNQTEKSTVVEWIEGMNI